MVMIRRSRLQRKVLVGLVVLAFVSGCGGRPDLDVWEGKWLDLAESVSEGISGPTPPDRVGCDRLLGEIRGDLPGLQPAPNDVLEAAVVLWAEFGESVFFECPLVRGEHAGWDAAVLELQRLRVEIDAEIEFERSRG